MDAYSTAGGLQSQIISSNCIAKNIRCKNSIIALLSKSGHHFPQPSVRSLHWCHGVGHVCGEQTYDSYSESYTANYQLM